MFPRPRTVSLLLIIASAYPAYSAIRIQRYLESLKLGDSIKQIEQIYPPARDWPHHVEPRGGLTRIHIERGYSKWFPPKVRTVRLGMKRGKLVHLHLIYNRAASRERPVSKIVGDLSLIYGEPRRHEGTYFWWDKDTVIAVSDAEIKTLRGRELRAGIELMERKYFKPFKT